MSMNILPEIRTSEKWHSKMYGLPKECYDRYFGFRTVPEQTVEIIKQKFSKMPIEEINHWENKWNKMVKLFPFDKSRKILDIGSPGHGDELLLRRCPKIEEIICIDGDKDAIECFKPFLNSKIKPIYCNFYEENFPQLNCKFDTIMQIDFPEHMPDKLYEKVTKWAVKFLTASGVLFVSTPRYPTTKEQEAHISVKNRAYFMNFFNSINMKIEPLWEEKRIHLIVKKRR